MRRDDAGVIRGDAGSGVIDVPFWSFSLHIGFCLWRNSMPINVKLSDILVAEAKRLGAVHHRSLPKQIEYWSQIGRIAEENPDLPFALIRDILVAREEPADEKYNFG
jgi:hypothetical protein